jgi:hypothetical protein
VAVTGQAIALRFVRMRCAGRMRVKAPQKVPVAQVRFVNGQVKQAEWLELYGPSLAGSLRQWLGW